MVVRDVCRKKGASLRKISRTYGKPKSLLVIESSPVATCPHCGDSNPTAYRLKEIERIKLHRKSLAVERPLEVARYAHRGCDRLLRFYEDGLHGYTYLEEGHPR
jgi:hypothetical protein